MTDSEAEMRARIAELAKLSADAYWIIHKAQGWIGSVTYDHLGKASKEWLARARQTVLLDD